MMFEFVFTNWKPCLTTNDDVMTQAADEMLWSFSVAVPKTFNQHHTERGAESVMKKGLISETCIRRQLLEANCMLSIILRARVCAIINKGSRSELFIWNVTNI